MELYDPDVRERRGSFHGRYLKSTDQRDQSRRALPRLLDCLLAVAPSNDPEYLDDPGAGEFAVVDVVTKEKGFFEMPYGCTPDMVTGLIEGHFGTSAFQVGPKLWFV